MEKSKLSNSTSRTFQSVERRKRATWKTPKKPADIDLNSKAGTRTLIVRRRFESIFTSGRS